MKKINISKNKKIERLIPNFAPLRILIKCLGAVLLTKAFSGRFGFDALKLRKLQMISQKQSNEHVKDALHKLFGDKLTAFDHNQLVALALAYFEEEISNERLQYALEMHKAVITNMLGKMCNWEF